MIVIDGMGERMGQEQLANLKGGTNCLNSVTKMFQNIDKPFIGLISKHSLEDYVC